MIYRTLQVIVAVQSSMDPYAWALSQWWLWPGLACHFFQCGP